MSRQRNGQSGRRRRRARKHAVNLWVPVGELPEAKPIVAAQDPTVLIRSLGDPPLLSASVAAGHHMVAVVERSAALAVALAASGNLLSNPNVDEDAGGWVPTEEFTPPSPSASRDDGRESTDDDDDGGTDGESTDGESTDDDDDESTTDDGDDEWTDDGDGDERKPETPDEPATARTDPSPSDPEPSPPADS